jgi:DUF1365 family protein
MTESAQLNSLNSQLFVGWVRHRRFSPKQHEFNYPLFMAYIDLDELDAVCGVSNLISNERFNWLSFRRSDYYGNSQRSLKDEVIARIESELLIKNSNIHRVCMLTNLRVFGYQMNPVTFYYAYNDQNQLIAIMPEITNTPWDEKFQYVLPTPPSNVKSNSKSDKKFLFEVDKKFHVSPFHAMNIKYLWRFSKPDQKNNLIHLENWREESKIFDATLKLSPIPFSAKNVRKTLIRFPWMTVKVALGIYINALKLWLKGVPFYGHPNKKEGKTI